MKRKLLVVATLAWVAPLSAHQAPKATMHDTAGCPHEHEGVSDAGNGGKGSAPTVIAVQAQPAAASLLSPGRSSLLMP